MEMHEDRKIHCWIISVSSKKLSGKIRNFLESNENEYTTYYKVSDTAREIVREIYSYERVNFKKS
jgi:hypothetical protein